MASTSSGRKVDDAVGPEDLAGMTDRAMKALSIMLNPPHVDVGTTPSVVVHTEDKLRLLHYLPLKEGGPASPPVLVVYALINRPYILDLQPDRSVVRALLERGHDVYLIDWGSPSAGDSSLTLADYVDGYIDRCVGAVLERSGVPRLTLFGYCMGGTLSVMYAALHPENVRNLVIMAAPVDADTDDGLLHIWSRREWYDADKIVDTLGNVPADFMNLGYNILDPLLNNVGKLVHLTEIVDNDDAVANYLRMEKWVADGIPMAGETFRQFLKDIYQENRLIKNRMRLGDRTVDLRAIDMPLLLVMGSRDHLVPPAATRPLLEAVASTDKESKEIEAGHIGISVGGRAHRELWPAVSEWIMNRSDAGQPPASPAPGRARRGRPPRESEDGAVGLGTIKGIGPSYARRLGEAGVKDARGLASADLEALSREARIPLSRLKAWKRSLEG